MSVKKPTELLKEEHQAVLEKLAALESAIGNLEQRESISASLRELASFFEVDFWVHFDKEEKALFPEFDNFMPRGSGPLAVMLDEHEVLRDTNEAMQQAIGSYLGDEDSAEVRQAIRQYGSHFIEFLRGHIFKEDSILFSMADMHLNPAQNDRVVNLFVEMDRASQSRSRKEG
ncbi:MAG: hemerythrin domain-containing protein [Dehalococcoidales bacterium]|nr:hemerythrin domain-containing protein [Dehalococcoidales bacterium]